jgi:ribose transport system substrate-binding protein
MRDRSTFVLLALSLVAAALVTLLWQGEGPSRPAADRVVAIFKTSSASNDFWASVREGIQAGAADFGFAASLGAPKEEIYVEEQIALVRQAVSARPSAIVLAATDVDRLVDPVREARRAGIHVVLVDSFISTRDAEAEVGTDNEEAGKRCGEALLRAVAPGSKVAVLSYVKGSSTAIGRERGLLSALGDRVVVVGTSYSGSDADTAYEQTRALLARPDRPKGIAALNLPTTVGAARALAESGRQGEVALVGFDNSAEIVKFIERGVIRSIVIQQPFNMGYLSMKSVRDLLDGRQGLGFINTGSVVVDRDNMFSPANQKLLFPVAPLGK